MTEFKAELHKLLLKIITNLGSSKIWLSIAGIGLSCYMGFKYGGTEGLILSLAGSIGIPLVYVGAKAYQNTHGANAPTSTTVINTMTDTGTSTATTTSTPVVLEPEVPISLVKDRVKALQKMLTEDQEMWDYLKGALDNRIRDLVQHMLDLNPNLKTIDAVMEVVNQYLGKCLTKDECAAINAWLGLPEVIHAHTDVDILASFEQAAKAGRLVEYQIDQFRYMAKLWAANDIINEAISRVNDFSLPVAERRLALREFGIFKVNAAKSFFSGGLCTVWNVNHYEPFNGYALAGYPELSSWPV